MAMTYVHLIKLLGISLIFSLAPNQSQAQMVSENPKLIIAPVKNIPAGPYPDVYESICEGFLVTPKTIVGMDLQRMGWGIISSISLGPYQFISFAGEFSPGTSGMCKRTQGNIAVFENQNLTTIIYTKPEDNHLIGNLEVIEVGALRIWSGGFVEWPVVDINLTNNGYKIKELSKLQSFCEGKTIVPMIYENTIPQARERLLKFGWQPSLSGDDLWGRAQEIKDNGLPEIQSCSPTGLAKCRFAYENDYATLEVTTIGEYDAAIINYSVACNR